MRSSASDDTDAYSNPLRSGRYLMGIFGGGPLSGGVSRLRPKAGHTVFEQKFLTFQLCDSDVVRRRLRHFLLNLLIKSAMFSGQLLDMSVKRHNGPPCFFPFLTEAMMAEGYTKV
jgi:hypothetical protein